MREFTVLGSCGAWPSQGRSTSGFLLRYDGWRIVLDLGYATLPRLLKYCPDGIVDAVVITHEHPDHCVDLSALFRIRYYDESRSGRIPLYCPPGVVARIDQLEPRGDLREVFDIHELPGEHRVGPIELEGKALPHFVPNAGIRLTAPDLTIAYTGDTGPTPDLVELGCDADLFIMEATHQIRKPVEHENYLLTAREAGRYAKAAGAKAVLLTHFWPTLDRRASVEEAALEFPGRIFTADEDMTIGLGSK